MLQGGADELGFRKDANHVLMEDGPEALRSCLEVAEPYPIRGLFRCVTSCYEDTSHSCWACHWWALLSAQHCCVRAGRFSDFWDEIKAYHGMQQTSDIAVSTGWKSVDEFYRVGRTCSSFQVLTPSHVRPRVHHAPTLVCAACRLCLAN